MPPDQAPPMTVQDPQRWKEDQRSARGGWANEERRKAGLDLLARATAAEAKYTNLLAESATIKERANRLESEKEAAEAHVAELVGALANVAAAIGSVRFMDPPDGGDVSLSEQVRRMRVALEVAERSCR